MILIQQLGFFLTVKPCKNKIAGVLISSDCSQIRFFVGRSQEKRHNLLFEGFLTIGLYVKVVTFEQKLYS